MTLEEHIEFDGNCFHGSCCQGKKNQKRAKRVKYDFFPTAAANLMLYFRGPTAFPVDLMIRCYFRVFCVFDT